MGLGWAGLGGSEHREPGGGNLCGGPVETPVLLQPEESGQGLAIVIPSTGCSCGDSPSLQSQSHR